ncbi:MAG: hypothetical protein V1710_02475 [Candidatus Bathyarchaeota archaeon]
MKNQSDLESEQKHFYFLVPFFGVFMRIFVFQPSHTGNFWYQHYCTLVGLLYWALLDKSPKRLIIYLLISAVLSGFARITM